MLEESTTYDNQVGAGVYNDMEYSVGNQSNFIQSHVHQKGCGLGAFLGGLDRKTMPLSRQSLHPIAGEMAVLTKSGRQTKRKALNSLDAIINKRRKYKRKRTARTTQKGSGRRSARTTTKQRKPAKKKKKTVKKKTIRKPNKTSHTRKIKKRDVYDIFGVS